MVLQHRLQTKVDCRERIIASIPEYAAYLMNRLEIGKDGKTVYERIKGKKPTVLGIEFGEKLMYKVKPSGSKLEKINARWEFGIFVGVRRRSGEVWIATKDKILTARSVRRIPAEQRWSMDSLSWIQGVPWRRYKDALDGDGELPEGLTVRDLPQETRPVGDSEPRIMLLLGISRFRKKMLKNMDIPGDVGDVPVGSEVWADNPIQTLAEPDLGI